MSTLWLADASHLARIGVKGPAALAWLQAQNIEVPHRANTWRPLDGAGEQWNLIARLGNTELLLEQDAAAARVRQLELQLQADIAGVYPVLREDSELVIGGACAASALAEVCNIDFARADTRQRPLFMTLMAGVAVLVIPQFDGDQRRYRIWCDPSFGAYLRTTLNDVIAHHSGVILGLEQLAAPPRSRPGTERSAL